MTDDSTESKGTEFSCEDALRFIDNSRTSGFAKVSKEFRFICVNQAFCEILNTVSKRIVGTSFQEWTVEKDREADNDAAQELIAGKRMEYTFFTGYKRAGSTPNYIQIVNGTLEVFSVWRDNQFDYFLVKFTPLTIAVRGEWRGLSWPRIKAAVEWTITNWKTIAVVLVVTSSLIFGGSSSLLDALRTAQEAKKSADSLLQPELPLPSPPQP